MLKPDQRKSTCIVERRHWREQLQFHARAYGSRGQSLVAASGAGSSAHEAHAALVKRMKDDVSYLRAEIARRREEMDELNAFLSQHTVVVEEA